MKTKDKFSQLKKEGKKAFIAYIPFGFPDAQYTSDIVLALQQAGVDAVEIGIPFSDPLADGPIIQRAAEQALNKGANLGNFFQVLESLSGKVQIPLIIMTYYNPILRFGMDKFFKRMNAAGIESVMIVDLPIEESEEYIKKAEEFNLETIFFITPTTQWRRARLIIRAAGGFIYYISVTGITGERDFAYGTISEHIKRIKKISNLAVCVGFGIHSRQQVQEVSSFSDGVIVGSSIVKFIGENYQRKDFLDSLKKYIKLLKDND